MRGATKHYSVDEKDNEHIVRLSIENWWTGDRHSFMMRTPSIFYIDAWEETDLLTITLDDMTLLNTIPAFVTMKARLDENHAYALLKRVNANISLSAEKHYGLLAECYPEFLQRFPQHIIASYLGVTKETLSRIRQNAAKK